MKNHHDFLAPEMFNISANDISEKGKERIGAKIRAMQDTRHSYRDMAAGSGISKSTLQRWTYKEMETKSQEERLARRGRRSTLTVDQSEQLISQARERRRVFLPVDIRWTSSAVEEITGGAFRPSDPWCSKFWKKESWPSRKASWCNEKELHTRIKQSHSSWKSKSTLQKIRFRMIKSVRLMKHVFGQVPQLDGRMLIWNA